MERERVRTIVLASDFLHAKDSSVFKDYYHEKGIKVYIKHLSTDSIIKHIERYKYNSEFDGVFMYSSFTLNRLSKEKCLHPFPEEMKEHPLSYRSPSNDWVVLGLDPYILQMADSGEVINTYNELTFGNKWKPVLNDEELASFQASVIHQFGRKGFNKSFPWLKKMNDQMTWQLNDSVALSDFTLTRYTKLNDSNKFTIPNQNRGGAFYDGIGIAPIVQSKHYLAISDLALFYMNSHFNQRLNYFIHAFPFETPRGHSSYSYQNSYPLFFRCSPNECVIHYRELEKFVKKL